MKKEKENIEQLAAYFQFLSREEKEAILNLVRTMAEETCKHQTGYSIQEYNQALEVAEAETAYPNSEVLNDVQEWLSNKKKKAIA